MSPHEPDYLPEDVNPLGKACQLESEQIDLGKLYRGTTVIGGEVYTLLFPGFKDQEDTTPVFVPSAQKVSTLIFVEYFVMKKYLYSCTKNCVH